MIAIHYDCLAACLDKVGRQDDAEARAKIRDFLWLVKGAFGTLGAVPPDKSNRAEYAQWVGQRAEATQLIGLLVRLMNDRAVNPDVIENRRQILITIGAEVGLPNLHNQLRQFAEDIGVAVFASSTPLDTLKSLLYGPRKAGQPKRDEIERIKIVAQVFKLLPGMAPSEAYKKVAEDLGKKANVTPGAVRNIVKSMIGKMNIADVWKDEDARKDNADVSLARLVASDWLEFDPEA
jgi:hypothetical protein